MKKSQLFTFGSHAVIAVVAGLSAPAFAQEEAADEVAGAVEDVSDRRLDAIVVTAAAGNKSQIASAISVTKIDENLIKDFQPSSESELFRMVPGIQVAGTAGPGGNSNIGVRGMPVATGGSPFVQIQEDGLPTVLFGDIQFGNNDYWTRFDASVAAVEGVRGGSASTFASQAPGAVINYISHTGEEEGGFIRLNKGLSYDETKVDFRYGGDLNESMYYHIGGYFKVGSGPLGADYNVSESIQVKGNITKEFDRGYTRFFVKVADTQEPNYTGAPALATRSGNSISDIEPFPGFDGRSQSNYSVFNQDFLIVNRDGDLERVGMDGITTEALALGNEFDFELSDNFSVNNKLRWTDMSGGFTSPFFNVARASSVIGSVVNGQTVTSLRYAAGPRAGQTYTGTYINNNVNVRTNIRDIGSFVNDLGVTGKFDVGYGDITARVGYFYFDQKIAMDWHVNKATSEINGDNPAMLDLFAGTTRLTNEGISGYNNNWGDCCARDYDLAYTNEAPYVALDLDTDLFTVDGSVRQDRITASGFGQASSGVEFPTVVGGVSIPTIRADGPKEVLNYSRDYTSWTVGGLYKFNGDTSFFARAAKGHRFNGDRQTLSGKITPGGKLNQAGEAAAVDIVNQYEIGVKNRGSLFGGDYSGELTAIQTDFAQSTFEINPLVCGLITPGAGTCIIDAKYESKAVEFFGTYGIGALSLVGTATWSDALRATTTSPDFVRAPNIPDLQYTFSGNYDVNDQFTVGLSTTGQTNSVDGGGLEYPASAVFNGVVKYRPFDNFEVGLNAYNLFDEFDIRGAGGVADTLAGNQVVIGGAPAIGRTLTASIKYDF